MNNESHFSLALGKNKIQDGMLAALLTYNSCLRVSHLKEKKFLFSERRISSCNFSLSDAELMIYSIQPILMI